MQSHADQWRAEGRVLGLIPTMGGLHDGHVSLIRRAQAEADHVTVSIFVNPTQFGPNEDFEAYPRDLERDLRLLQELGGVDAVFAPDQDSLYPEGPNQQRIWVSCPELSEHLCGKYRPGHFQGVLTVVMKLLAACKPHICVFGLKDVQQYILLKQMVQDLSIDVRLIGGATARDSNGLAHSTRNEYLTVEERKQAQVLSKAITAAVELIESGEQNSIAIVTSMHEILGTSSLAVVQYAEIVTASTLQPMEQLTSGMEVIVAIAVYFRKVRLIDNAFVLVP